MIDVHVNGVRIGEPDYTATDGSTITLAGNLSLNDEVIVVSLANFAMADTYSRADALGAFHHRGANLTHRNLIENGDFRVVQRGTVFTHGSGGIGNTSLTADRWRLSGNTNSYVSFDAPNGHVNMARSTGTGPVTLYQMIEGGNWRKYLGKRMVLSCEVGPNGTLSPSDFQMAIFLTETEGTFTNPEGLASVSPTSLPGGFQRISVAFTLPASTTKTGMYVHLAASNVSPSNFFSVRNVQLEEVVPGMGDQPTPFERLPYSVMLAMCQRHYEVGSAVLMGYSPGSGSMIASYIAYNTRKRVSVSTVALGATPTEHTTNTLGPITAASAAGDGAHGFRIYASSNAVGNAWYTNTFMASADL